jgi:hypothetical protein
MYATLDTYDQHDAQCPRQKEVVREGFTLTKTKKPLIIDTPQARKERRGGKGIDSCRPYDPARPYEYMFNPHFNPYPYDPDYRVVDGGDDGKQYLNVLFSYPSSESSTRVRYCDGPPEMWHFCDDDY